MPKLNTWERYIQQNEVAFKMGKFMHTKKLKVGIITFHFVNNFGGALQAYALRQIIDDECNAVAELIDYRNWFICLTDRIRMLPITTCAQELISGIQTMSQRVDRRKKFENFTMHFNKMTQKYLCQWQLNKNPPGDDKYICGSDQIWNPTITFGVLSCYYLRFEKKIDNRIAYAPSFGSSEIDKRFRKTIADYLNEIKCLSVREQSGQKLINRLTGRDALRLIDPTFLVSSEKWASIGVNPLKDKEPYILLYIMQRDAKVYEFAKTIKDRKKIKLVEISRYGYNPGFVDETLVSVGPEEFLGLFRDAEYICTNSYHGLVYSLIFEKEFSLIPCKHFTARINDLIALLHIENSIMDGEESGIQYSQYDKLFVRKVITNERTKALSYLKNSLGTNYD